MMHERRFKALQIVGVKMSAKPKSPASGRALDRRGRIQYIALISLRKIRCSMTSIEGPILADSVEKVGFFRMP